VEVVLKNFYIWLGFDDAFIYDEIPYVSIRFCIFTVNTVRIKLRLALDKRTIKFRHVKIVDLFLL
jgi:hypothetical protein